MEAQLWHCPGSTSAVQSFLGVAGIDVNVRSGWYGQTALAQASENGHEGIVQMLLGVAGIDVNLVDEFGWTALAHASKKGHGGIMKKLLGVSGIEPQS